VRHGTATKLSLAGFAIGLSGPANIIEDPGTARAASPSTAEADALSSKPTANTKACAQLCMPVSVNSFDRPVTSLTVADGYVYWIIYASALAGVYRAPLGSTNTPTFLAPLRSLQEGAGDWDLAVDDNGVVFALDSGEGRYRGGPILRIDGPESYRVLAEGEYYPCRAGGSPHRIAVDATDVYWTESVGRYIDNVDNRTDPTCTSFESFWYLRTVPKQGGPARILTRVTSLNLTLDEEFIYWTRDDALVRLRKDGPPGDTPSVLASGLLVGDSPALARDGCTIYVGGRDGRVYGVVRKTGVVHSISGPLAPGSSAQDFTFDDRYVYWSIGGTTYRAHKNGGQVCTCWPPPASQAGGISP
jgi:hypothetical protein